MFLKTLSLTNYKNFDTAFFELDHKINCFVGANGVGKTNVLDAIYHLSYGKSYFNPVASQNIKHSTDFFAIDGVYEKKDKDEKIVIALKRGQKKTIKRNGKSYDKFSEHVGLIPLVIISPADRDLIIEGSDTRRKFMDSIIAQSDKIYLDNLIKYNKVVAQRNALLKYFALNNTFNNETLEAYNHQMLVYGQPLFEKRKTFASDFEPIFKSKYNVISNANEEVTLTYQSQLLEDNFETLLSNNLKKDRMLQFSSIGVHKDDLVFEKEGHSVKKYGSQGQQKSYLIALKLAQFDFIKKQSGETPILVLDDIFDKLDTHRVEQIVNLVDSKDFGQIFISDTHSDRTETVVKQVHQSYKIFNLEEQ